MKLSIAAVKIIDCVNGWYIYRTVDAMGASILLYFEYKSMKLKYTALLRKEALSAFPGFLIYENLNKYLGVLK